MGLATTGGAEVEGESQVKKSRRAVGTGGRLAGLRLRLRLRLAGWLLCSIFIGHPGARTRDVSRARLLVVPLGHTNCSTLMLCLFTFLNINGCKSGLAAAA